jgi:NAD+ kinase
MSKNEIKTVGMVIRPSTTNIKEYFQAVRSSLEAKGARVLVEKVSANLMSCAGTEFEQMCEDSDILISLGGDGTLISLARKSYAYSKPILGINAGNLGFLTTASKDDFEGLLEAVFAGEYVLERRMMLEFSYEQNGKEHKRYAFNDCVVTKNIFSKMINIEVYDDQNLINAYYGDGLIICTPSGSTAYNISSGGPVVYPLANNFILTPICPHALTQRSLVIPGELDLRLVVWDTNAVAIMDGQETVELVKGASVSIKKASQDVLLIAPKGIDYFKILRQKLSWGKE